MKFHISINISDMNKRFFLIILSIILFHPLTSISQNYTNKQLALISYGYNVQQGIKPQFDEYSHLFSGLGGTKVDRVISSLKTNTWILLKERLEEETGMYILPVDAHGRNFKYDSYGFPNMSINNAIRKGSSQYYMRIGVTIANFAKKGGTGYGSSTKRGKNSSELIQNNIQPEITIEVITYTKNGIIPMQKVIASAVAEEPWLLDDSIFVGLKMGEPFDLESPNNIMYLVNEAITNLLKKF